MGLFDFLLGPPDVENLKAKKDVEGLLKALKYKKDTDVRVRAAVALADLLGPPDIENLKAMRDVEGLLKALKYKKDTDVREKAAVALGDIGDERSVKPLIYALNDEAADIRENAAAALEAMFRLPDIENLKAKKDVEGLLEALKYEEKDTDVRENAAAAIRELQLTFRTSFLKHNTFRILSPSGSKYPITPQSCSPISS